LAWQNIECPPRSWARVSGPRPVADRKVSLGNLQSNRELHFKSFAAPRIIDLLEQRGVLLQQLRALKLRHKKESEYQIWQEGSQPQQIRNDEMMRQKIEYLHTNPVVRGYVDEPEEFN
jgi:hypothetical protein